MKNQIIPTPVECKLSNNMLNFDKFKIKGQKFIPSYVLEFGADLFDPMGKSLMIFEKLIHENSQAYKIAITHNRVVIAGAGELAFIYAIASLKQIACIENNQILLPKGEIFDYPEFIIRGVNWNLLAEARGWSQDAGDGKEAFVKRFISALDMLASFKLNMVMVDGLGWNSERFPGYGAMMKKFNQEARRRGIRLCYIGYNAGYGAQWYDFDGKSFENRKTYPDGEIYSCVCSHTNIEKSSTMGTCLSNEELLKLKAEDLQEFVKTIEPGALYLHGLDISSEERCITSWQNRCPACRKEWPNDDLNATDGMAGAYATFYDKLYDAIAEVKNPETDYDAARDCMVNMVSPNYTDYYESDEEWQNHLKYFGTLSKCLKNKDVYLMLREQFFNEKNGEPRFAQLHKAVGDNCKLSCVYFSSGSGYYNSITATADVACIKLFDGIDAVNAGSGNAFQEPRQVLNAEFMWNPNGSNFGIDIPGRAKLKDFLEYFTKLSNRELTPETIFGEQGLISLACENLYGEEAGALVAQAQKMQAPSDAKGGIIAPLWNALLPGWVFSCFRFQQPVVQWQEGIDEKIKARSKELEKLMGELIPLNNEAAELYSQASKIGSRREHLQRMSDTCAYGAKLAAITQGWLKIFISAFETSEKVKGIDELNAKIQFELVDLNKNASGIIDRSGGDASQAIRSLEFIANDLMAIKHTLKTGEFLKPEKILWW